MAKNIPEGIVLSDPQVQIFYNILKEVYASTTQTIVQGDITTKTRERAILRQIEEQFKEADENVKAWIRVEIPTFYEAGMFETMKELESRGSDIRIDKSFASFHTQAIEAISQDIYQNINQGMGGISRTANRLVSQSAQQAVMERMAKGLVTGDARRKIEKDIVKTLKEDGISAITDKRGRSWDLLDYSKMLARTKLTQAQNTGTMNRMLESGYDLVIVSNHGGACPLCAPFEGKILSISGRNKGYISLDVAQSEGLFHPNCRHKITPYHDRFADAGVAWNKSTGKYVSFVDLPNQKINVKLPSFDKAKAEFETSGMEKYIKAFNDGDLKTLEKLRTQSPEDGRYNLHLKYLKGVVEGKGNTFNEVLELHKAVTKDMQIDKVSEFNKLLEGSNKRKTQEYVDGLPSDYRLKPDMERLLNFL